MRACVAVFCLLSALTAAGQTKHSFTFEDMMKLKRVEEPVVSPNGKWVLFAAVDVDLTANTKTPHVWVVPLNGEKAGSSTPSDHSQANDPATLGMTEGSKEREIISDQDADRPRWAPDGKRFAFISTKHNGSQVWIAEFDYATGTVTSKHRLTNIATEADGELWSPDGKNILFKSDVYPECDGAPQSEAECNAKKVQETKDSKVKALVFTHLLYRHWNAYKEGKRTHLFVISANNCTTDHVGTAASAVRPGDAGQERDQSRAALDRTAEGGCSHTDIARDLTPGDYDAPVFSLGGQDDYAFAPDGKEICYASNHDPEPAISTNNDLFTVPVNVGTAAKPALSGVEGAVRPGEAGQDPVELRSTRQPGAAVARRDAKNGYVAEVLAQTKDITADNKAADNTPLYSPDGKYIAYRAQQRPGYESDRWRLMLYDRKAGAKRVLADDFDGWVDSIIWHPSSKAIYFTSDKAGYTPLFRAGLDFGHTLVMHGTYDDPSFSPDGKTLLLTNMSLEFPNRIVSVDTSDIEKMEAKARLRLPKGGELGVGTITDVLPNPVADLNVALLSTVEMDGVESFWFTGAHNDKVEGFLLKPPNFDPNKKYPLKFIVHGGPQVPMGDEWSYRWNSELFAANGYVVIFINFHASPGYGQKFIDAVNADWGGAPYEDLMKGLDYAEQHYPFIDKDRECALGASFGGYMINWIMGHTNRFKCLVTHDGDFNLEADYGSTEELWFPEWELKGTPWTNREMYRKWSPHLFVQNFKTPTLVVHGQLDYRIDVSEGLSLFTTLQRLGVPSKMLYFPDEGHWVLKPQNSQLWYKTVNDWVDQWVGK